MGPRYLSGFNLNASTFQWPVLLRYLEKQKMHQSGLAGPSRVGSDSRCASWRRALSSTINGLGVMMET
jgi:hypothetical protein